MFSFPNDSIVENARETRCKLPIKPDDHGQKNRPFRRNARRRRRLAHRWSSSSSSFSCIARFNNSRKNLFNLAIHFVSRQT
ncbi:hypothetical protein DERF_014341 [Dermatophagoides farinae]|uniref:Uncharacterized protein n=1 Tax=Dermatophagoides farinae TaxID=6954 RepID=A0A922L170_DERFA|nr:hypothetical protein DERF_014341 [Dermatophagoides farinae]